MIGIDYDLFKEIELYSKRHYDSSIELYKARNQNTKKIFNDIMRGKIAEFCNYFSLREAGYILECEPDLKIQTGSNKSYDSDLVVLGKNNILYEEKKYVHVKSISLDTYNKYGASFLVESNDPITINPKPNHYFSVMLQESFLVYKFHRWLNSCDVEYKAPRLKQLISKKAVYL